MDNFRTSKDLQVGNIVNIYVDYKFQKKLEGKAKLIKRKEKGFTFMLYNENLLTILENKVIDKEKGNHIPLTRPEKYRNKKYAQLIIMLVGIKKSGVLHVNQDLNNLYLLLKEYVNEELDNPKVLDKLLNTYRKDWEKYTDQRNIFFNKFDNETIIRFIQQTCLKNWCHSIWREETWVVEFVSDGYSTTFMTNRKVRTLICINPNEEGQNSEILHYITKENSIISNADRKEVRQQTEENEEIKEDTTFLEEELEFINEDALDIDVYDIEKNIVSFEEEGILEEFENMHIDLNDSNIEEEFDI
jgi:hypothetical protein